MTDNPLLTPSQPCRFYQREGLTDATLMSLQERETSPSNRLMHFPQCLDHRLCCHRTHSATVSSTRDRPTDSQCPPQDQLGVHHRIRAVSATGSELCPLQDHLSVHHRIRAVSATGSAQCPPQDQLSVHHKISSLSTTGSAKCPPQDQSCVHRRITSVSTKGSAQCPPQDQPSVHHRITSVSTTGSA